MKNIYNKVYVIAEAGINHNGDLTTALEMVKYAKNIGADCIKFQAFELDKLVSKEAKSAEYQKKETGEKKQQDVLKELQLTRSELKILFNECKKFRIDFLCTAFDEELLITESEITLSFCPSSIPLIPLDDLPLNIRSFFDIDLMHLHLEKEFV